MPDQSNVNSTNTVGTPNRAANSTPTNGPPRLTQQQLIELTNKFKELVTEAKRLGETTPRGKELLIQASKIKAVYDNYSRARQRQAAAAASGPSAGSSTTNVTTQQTANSNSASASSISTGTTPNNANNATNNNNQFAMLMRQTLTPEQNQQYEKLSIEFQSRAKNIRDKHTFIKQNIDTLTQEINKQTDIASKNQLVEKRAELLNNLKQLGAEHNGLRAQFQNGRRNFYLECAEHNPELKKILNRTQSAPVTQNTQQQQQQQQQQTQNVQKQVPQQSASQQEIQARKKVIEEAKQKQQEAQTNVKTETNAKSIPAGSPGSNTNNNTSAQVTNVNAAAASNSSNASSKQNMFKTSEPNIPITENLTTKSPTAVSYRVNRPTMSGGSAMNATALNTPVMTKIPPYEIDTERVMSKRKLRELVKTVGIDEGDGETVIDGDVEELLLDLADDFVTNVTSFACRLAKHRRSDNLNVKDIQLHLERNWNIRIPGYSADEIRSTRKWNPSATYNQKLQAVNGEKTHKGQSSNGKITKK